ncbi:hypothetical protein EJO52_24025 [Salmonella enterica subsp. enterica serovar Enteritidis]|nr:hypothetical protein [Salmonella enterica subsp. enterica serovar Enteritidis]
MVHIPLFAPQGDISLEAFEKDPIVAEALAAEPTAEVIDADGVELRLATIDEHEDALDRAFPAVAALREISFDVAPTIESANYSDVALVRNVQESASIALGLPSEALLTPTDRVEVGEALVVEGFKDTVIKAMKKIWDIIVDIALTLAAAFEKLTRLVYDETRNFQKAVADLEQIPKGKYEENKEVVFKPEWRTLFPNRNKVGGVDALKSNIDTFNQMFLKSDGHSVIDGLGLNIIDFHLDKVEKLPVDYLSFLHAVKSTLENRGSVEGTDVITPTVSGKRIRYINGAVFLKEFDASKDNIIDAVKRYLDLDIIVEDVEWDNDPETYVLPTPDDLRSVRQLTFAKDLLMVTKRGRAFSEMFSRNKIRTMERIQEITMKRFNEQNFDASYQPYIEIYPKLVKRAILLCGKENRIQNQFAYQYLRALTSFINTLVKAYTKG